MAISRIEDYLKRINKTDDKNILGILAELQHNYSKTIFIDFTNDVYTALFFASNNVDFGYDLEPEGRKNHYMSLYIIDKIKPIKIQNKVTLKIIKELFKVNSDIKNKIVKNKPIDI